MPGCASVVVIPAEDFLGQAARSAHARIMHTKETGRSGVLNRMFNMIRIIGFLMSLTIISRKLPSDTQAQIARQSTLEMWAMDKYQTELPKHEDDFNSTIHQLISDKHPVEPRSTSHGSLRAPRTKLSDRFVNAKLSARLG